MARRRQVIDSSDQESDPADEEVSGSETGSSSGSESGNDLLDVEAHDAPLPGDDSSEVEVDEKFEPFMRLPPELRQKIWESVCPHLASRHGRILSLNFFMELNVPNGPPSASTWPDDEDEEPVKGPRLRFTVNDGLSLQDHTAALRVVMAVHGESRQFALKLFPDTIDMRAGSGDAILRFNKDRDIIMPVCRSEMYRLLERNLKSISQVKHIAFEWIPGIPDDAVLLLDRGLVGAMPNLETIYLCRRWMARGLSKSKLRWCASPMANCHVVETWQKEQFIGEDTFSILCWPDVKRHPDFAKTHVDPDFFEGFPARCFDRIEKGGVKLLPMVTFEEASGTKRFYSLVKEHDDGLAEDGANSDWSESDTADESESEDDYESDGIDDSEHPQVEEADSQDELLDDGGDSDDDDDDADDNNGREVVHRPKRRRVVDSDDDDDDDDDEEQGKGASSSGGNKRPAKRNKSNEATMVISSDEDEDEEEDEEGSSSDDDGSDDENPQPRLSLAERLAQARRDNPIPGEEEDDEDSEDDSDECSYGRGEDEEEDEEDSEDGMVERFAEESEGEGEDGYDEDEEGY